MLHYNLNFTFVNGVLVSIRSSDEAMLRVNVRKIVISSSDHFFAFIVSSNPKILEFFLPGKQNQ
jgi:hypothetical protein